MIKKNVCNLFAALFFFLLSYSNVYAQEETFTQQEKETQSELIKEKLDDFQDELKIIVDGKEKSTKQAAVTTALKLFIGEGNRYQCIDESGMKILHRPVRVQISSKMNGIVSQSMKSYLNKLALMPAYSYDKILIDQADVVRIDNINNTGNGEYIAIATVMQHYFGSKDGKPHINDYATKTIKVYISESEYSAIKKGSAVYLYPKLGDMKITETWH